MPFRGQQKHYAGDLGGGSFGHLGGMGSVGGRKRKDMSGLPSMGGIPSQTSFDVGPHTDNSGHTNHVNPISMSTSVDLGETSGTELSRWEFMCMKREPSNDAGTGHVIKSWTAMNQYFWEQEAINKYGSCKHHAQPINSQSQGLSVDWALLYGVQVNFVEKYSQKDFFDEYVVNMHRGRRAEVLNVWAADVEATIREPVWLFGNLVKFAFDKDSDRLASTTSLPIRGSETSMELFDMSNTLTAKQEKESRLGSSSRHIITWQILPYADTSPAGPHRGLYSNYGSKIEKNKGLKTDAYTGMSIRLGQCSEFYPNRRCKTNEEEAEHGQLALFPHLRGVTSNWKTEVKHHLNYLSRVTIQLYL